MSRYAIVLTHNRPGLLAECVAAVQAQVELTLIIDNASQPPVRLADLHPADEGHAVGIKYVLDQPPNLAHLWNLGIETVTQLHADRPGPWWIAFLCDDAIVPAGWVDAVTAAMTQTGAAAGCSNPFGSEHPARLKTEPDGDLTGRMVGWAFILDGTKNLRADESMRWWWCDTDLDWQARAAGGMVMVGGYQVPNRLPNDFTLTVPGLGQQAGTDGETFAAKWNRRPW